jgi:hypothetical protein
MVQLQYGAGLLEQLARVGIDPCSAPPPVGGSDPVVVRRGGDPQVHFSPAQFLSQNHPRTAGVTIRGDDDHPPCRLPLEVLPDRTCLVARVDYPAPVGDDLDRGPGHTLEGEEVRHCRAPRYAVCGTVARTRSLGLRHQDPGRESSVIQSCGMAGSHTELPVKHENEVGGHQLVVVDDQAGDDPRHDQARQRHQDHADQEGRSTVRCRATTGRFHRMSMRWASSIMGRGMLKMHCKVREVNSRSGGDPRRLPR